MKKTRLAANGNSAGDNARCRSLTHTVELLHDMQELAEIRFHGPWTMTFGIIRVVAIEIRDALL